MNIEKNRGVTMSMSKRLFASIAFQKEIDMEVRGTNLVERSTENKIKLLDYIVQNTRRSELLRDKSADVINYLNSTMGIITPIKKIIIEN